ncbi:ribosomal protein S9 [Pelagophyceae sp. CCMP2097]|nr:ribosomal protein S9 [Pelagophyceae sp. CCMP2097]
MKAAPTRVAVRDALGRAYGTGRRKEATARVWVFPGDGKITVNRQNMHEYFQRGSLCNQVILPFMATLTQCEFDVWCTVKGGGKSGQSGAIRHGVSRALEKYDPEYRAPLKRLGYLTRDPRMVERKKPGRKKARKLKQWVKR